MIRIENTEVFGIEGAIRGMRNPKNSWERSDSKWVVDGNKIDYHLEKNDLELCKKLVAGGTEHRKFLRMIHVQADILAPLYWWKEYDTYKVGTVANSCSTMHKIDSRELTLDDFSHEHLNAISRINLERTISEINGCMKYYKEDHTKDWWWQMIQLLPTSYNQKRTIDVNYEVLMNIHRQRRNHKLDEWHTFCDWIEELPYMKEFLET